MLQNKCMEVHTSLTDQYFSSKTQFMKLYVCLFDLNLPV